MISRKWLYIVPPVVLSIFLSNGTRLNALEFFIGGFIFWIPYWVALFLSGYKVKPELVDGSFVSSTNFLPNDFSQKNGFMPIVASCNSTALTDMKDLRMPIIEQKIYNSFGEHKLLEPISSVGFGPEGQPCTILNGQPMYFSNPSHDYHHSFHHHH